MRARGRIPSGWSCGPGGQRERELGPDPGPWLPVASPGPDRLTTKAVAAGEPGGAAGGRAEAETGRPGVGWGGAIGEGSGAQRLAATFEVRTVVGAARRHGSPSPLLVSRRNRGSFPESGESHVFKFL
uniref:Uncharacterized protein n=1 Tax=Myotis myotis TaxID=51298 RepID=A0A7J7Z486_MYOMY|nr:hypothetical protein mMyoMyo1_010478 [Myotis myotis]